MSELSSFLMHEVEMPLVEVVADMEDAGYPIDPGYFQDLQSELEPRRDAAVGQLRAIAGNGFNPVSAQQVAKLLYTDLELPIRQRTAGGRPATNKEALQQLDHDAARDLLTYRGLAKIISTYCTIPDKASDDGRLHVDFRPFRLRRDTLGNAASEPEDLAEGTTVIAVFRWHLDALHREERRSEEDALFADRKHLIRETVRGLARDKAIQDATIDGRAAQDVFADDLRGLPARMLALFASYVTYSRGMTPAERWLEAASRQNSSA